MNNKIKILIFIIGIILTFFISHKSVYCQSYPYDRSAALAYADSYWCWPDYNSDYYIREYKDKYGKEQHSSDCANFAMQCLSAGGRDTYDPFYNKKPLHFSGYDPSYYSCTKGLAPYLRTIAIETQGDPSNVEAGDIILMKYEPTDDSFYHAVVVVEVNGENIYYAGHTTDTDHSRLSNPHSQKLHYFHILDGYLFWSDWGWGYWRNLWELG